MPTYLTEDKTAELATKKHKSSERIINPIFDIVSLAEESLKYKETTDRKGRLSATGGAGFCELMSYRKATEEITEEINACNVFWFRYGQESENIYIDAMMRSGHYIGDQIRLTENTPCTIDLQLGGFLDILVKDDTNKLRIVEAKTCGGIPSKPKAMHKTQILVYMSWYGLNGTLFYQSRNVGNIYGELKARQFDIDFSYEKSHQIITNIFVARMCVDKKVKPYSPAQIIFKKHECQSAYCPFISDCWDNKNEDEIEDDYLEILKDAKIKATSFLLEENRQKRLNDLIDKIAEKRKQMNDEIILRNKQRGLNFTALPFISKKSLKAMV